MHQSSLNILRVMGCPSYKFGGQERYLVKFANSCRRKKYQLYIIYENNPKSDEFITALVAEGAELISLKPKRYLEKIIYWNSWKKFLSKWYDSFDINALRNINKIIKENNIHIVHSYFSPSLYALFAGKLLGKKTFRTIGNPIFSAEKRQSFLNNQIKILYCYLRHIFPTIFIDNIICVAQFLCKDFNNFNVSNGKLNVIYSGTDTEYFNPKFINPILIRKEFHLKNNDFILGFTGRLEAQKNLMFLLEVFKKVINYVPNAKMIITGEGSLKDQLIKRCLELEIYEKVIFTGRRNDVAEIVMTFNVFVMPSLFEGMPSSLLEAMSLERSCVVSNIKNFYEIIDDDENGYICELGNTQEFVNRIIELHNDPGKRIKIGKAARKSIIEGFNVNTRVEKTINLYESKYFADGN